VSRLRSELVQARADLQHATGKVTSLQRAVTEASASSSDLKDALGKARSRRTEWEKTNAEQQTQIQSLREALASAQQRVMVFAALAAVCVAVAVAKVLVA